MLLDVIIPFVVVGLAELGDKTQLAVLTLAAKQKEHMQLFWGAMLGFFLVDGLAVLFGGLITQYIPLLYIKTIAGIIFITFGIIALSSKDGELLKLPGKGAFTSAFVLIFIAELGDKTQISSALFATQYNPYFAFFGILGALALLTGLAIAIGKKMKEKLKNKHITLISGVLFIVIGIVTLIPVARNFLQ